MSQGWNEPAQASTGGRPAPGGGGRHQWGSQQGSAAACPGPTHRLSSWWMSPPDGLPGPEGPSALMPCHCEGRAPLEPLDYQVPDPGAFLVAHVGTGARHRAGQWLESKTTGPDRQGGHRPLVWTSAPGHNHCGPNRKQSCCHPGKVGGGQGSLLRPGPWGTRAALHSPFFTPGSGITTPSSTPAS